MPESSPLRSDHRRIILAGGFALATAMAVGRPHHVASTIGLLTALYGLGQILGPPMAAYLLKHAATLTAGFDLALKIAAGSLLLGQLCLACWCGNIQ